MALTDEVTVAPENLGKGGKAEKDAQDAQDGKIVSESVVRPSSIHSSQTPGQNGDVEKHGAGPESSPLPDLKRKLKSRHLQMIAIG